MRSIVLAWILLFVLSGCSNRQLFLLSSAALVADWGQTRNITERYGEGYFERNPILGTHPSRGEVNAYFITWLGLNSAAHIWMPPKYQPYWFLTIIAVQGPTILANKHIGLKFSY